MDRIRVGQLLIKPGLFSQFWCHVGFLWQHARVRCQFVVMSCHPGDLRPWPEPVNACLVPQRLAWTAEPGRDGIWVVGWRSIRE